MRINFYQDDTYTTIDAPSGKPLLDILDSLGDRIGPDSPYIASSGCRTGLCGRCLVLIDGTIMHSCLIPGFAIRGKRITTFNGFRKTKEFIDIQRGFREVGYSPCRLCYPSRVLISQSLLEKYTTPTEEQIIEGFEAVTCHCVGFSMFSKAVKLAARFRRLHG